MSSVFYMNYRKDTIMYLDDVEIGGLRPPARKLRQAQIVVLAQDIVGLASGVQSYTENPNL